MFEQPKKEREHGTQPKGVNNALTHQAWNLRGTTRSLPNKRLAKGERKECNHKGGVLGKQPRGGYW